jgi:protein-S-isoprenylcysteine O-methyltransferase Ste14
MLARAIVAFLALPGVVAIGLPIFLGWSINRSPQNIFLSALFLALGGGLLMWCVREFYIAGQGTLAPWAPPKILVTSGPYQFSRNPMYIGVGGTLAIPPCDWVCCDMRHPVSPSRRVL